MDSAQLNDMIARLGRPSVGRRLMMQAHHAAEVYGGLGRLRFHPENSELLPKIVEFGLRITGLASRARKNCLDYRVERQKMLLRKLPESFSGFRILHLSDIHADAIPDNGVKLLNLLEGLQGEYDLCVLTGDYRFQTSHTYQTCLNKLADLIAPIQCPHGIIGILGNHDFLEMVPDIESLGVQMLVNEAIPLERNGHQIWIAGTDDPHYYNAHNIIRALTDVPDRSFTVLLCHSPEAWREAVFTGIDLYLCGHTHGGQLCLPGRIPVITNAAVSRKYVSGLWQYGHMTGYTSRGTGASGTTARLCCPPEVAIHTLHRHT